MVDRIYINNDKFIFISSSKEVVDFYLEDVDKIDNVCRQLNASLEVVINFPLDKESIGRFFILYDKVLSDKNNIVIDISLEEDEEIIENYRILKDIENRCGCLFCYRYNTYSNASIDEIMEAIKFVYEQVEIVKYYNFSPVEALMFIYDMIRDREYLEEDEEEGLEISRNLSKVINSSKIVCGGFANMFSAIANKLGIYTENFYWKKEGLFSCGHVSNICYVNDPIYNIHKILEIDVTKGCNKMSDNRCFRNYSSFGNSILDVEHFNLQNELMYRGDSSNLFYRILQQYNKYIERFDNANNIIVNFKALNLIDKIKKYLLTIGCDVSCCLDIEILIKNNEEKNVIREKIDSLLEDNVLKNSFFGDKIDCCDFISVLYTVRRIEHSIDKDKFLFSIDELYNIINNYYGKRIGMGDFCLELIINLVSSGFIDGFELNEIEKDIMHMKLLSTLKKVKCLKNN